MSILRKLSSGVALLALAISAQCIDSKWDPTYTWVKDCTSTNPYDGQFGTGTGTATAVGEMKLTVGTQTRTLSWKLHWFKANLPGAVTRPQLPLLIGLHPWSDGSTVPQLLNSVSALMQYEGSWEDMLVLTVALETGNNLNTWWDGSKVGGVPTTWAMDGIVELIKARLKDACQLLGTAGATAIADKGVDSNRIYLFGPSMGGSGTYHIGLRHPEIFAAIHANAGFADYDGGPCGNENFCKSFTNDFIGTVEENLMMKGLDGKNYPARQYSNMSWFVGTHNGASWSASLGKGKRYEPPYLMMTHGKADDVVNVSSANRLAIVMAQKKFGYSFLRHPGGHSGENFIRLHWLLGFRKDQSFLAFTNNSTDLLPGGTSTDQYNYLNKISWQPSSIKDLTNHYEVKLFGTGTTDVTLRRLQNFLVEPGKSFHFWLNEVKGEGTKAVADSLGALTLPAVAVQTSATLIVTPDLVTPIQTPKKKARHQDGHGALTGKPSGLAYMPSEKSGDWVDGLGRISTPLIRHP